MNRTASMLHDAGSKAGFSLKKLLASALVGAAFAAMPAAHAAVLDFEGLDIQPLTHLQGFEYGGYQFTSYSNDPTAFPGDLSGAVFDGGDRDNCAYLACPTNNSSTYLTGLNDGVIFIDQTATGPAVQLAQFDAAFIGPFAGATYPAVPGLIQVQGYYADGRQSIYEYFDLGGQVNGDLSFQTFKLSDYFASQQFVEIAIFGYLCDDAGSCDAFGSNGGQFGIDNLVTSAVPEPSTYAMMLLGLAGIGAVSRRRNRAAAANLRAA